MVADRPRESPGNEETAALGPRWLRPGQCALMALLSLLAACSIYVPDAKEFWSPSSGGATADAKGDMGGLAGQDGIDAVANDSVGQDHDADELLDETAGQDVNDTATPGDAADAADGIDGLADDGADLVEDAVVDGAADAPDQDGPEAGADIVPDTDGAAAGDADTGDASDTGGTGDTGDAGDAGDAGDTGDTGDTGDGADGDLADGIDSCALLCDDGNSCTTDQCDPKGGCLSVPLAAPCSDGNPCTEGDQCKVGKCFPGPLKDCSDNQPCTTEYCTADAGCATKFNTAECDDGDACTVGDMCQQGQCSGAAMACDDGNPCSLDTCTAGQCGHTWATLPCSDANLCTDGDKCVDGKCQGGPPLACDDGNTCTQDGCSAGIGCVHNLIPSGTPCDDGSSCTTGDACSGGLCKGSGSNSCSDGNACTADACATNGACVHLALDGPCDDGDPCTVGEKCAAGACQSSGQGLDGDGDGHVAAACGGDDCNDTDKSTFPGAPDLCDGKQNDCAAVSPFEPCDDLDGDGYCAAGVPVYGSGAICSKGGGDCSDANPYVNPSTLVQCLDLVSPAGVAGTGPCSMRKAGNIVHMAWRGAAFDDLRYRRLESGVVQKEILVDRSLGLGPPALTVLANGSVAVAYTKAESGQAVVAFEYGGVFKARVIGPAKPGAVAITTDGQNRLHVLYTAKDAMLKHAVFENYFLTQQFALDKVELPSARALTTGSDGQVYALLRGTNSAVHIYAFAVDGSFVDTKLASFADTTAGGAIVAGPDGQLRACFKTLDTHKLALATQGSGAWTVDLAPADGNYGDDCALAADQAGSVHAVFENAAMADLQAYHLQSGKWTADTLTGAGPSGACDMVLDGAGAAQVGILGATLATYGAGTWALTALEPQLACTGPADLQLDAAGHRHLVNWTWPTTCYGTDASGSWSYGKIEVATTGAATSRPRVLVGADGNPSIGYTAYQGLDTVLYLASLGQSSWNAKAIAAWPGSGDGYGYPGVRLAQGASGAPLILYLPQNASTYQYAHLAGGAWQTQTTSASGVSQAGSDQVSFAWAGAPQVVYCSSWGEVRHATVVGGAWVVTTVDNGGCQWVAMTAADNGTVTAIYSTGKAIRYARLDGDFWVVGDKNAPQLPLFGAAVSMVGSYPSMIRLAYRTDVATYYAQGGLGQPFATAPIMPPTCQVPSLALAAGSKLVVACDGRMIGVSP